MTDPPKTGGDIGPPKPGSKIGGWWIGRGRKGNVGDSDTGEGIVGDV
jgi:hypothetical protein